MTEVRNDRLKTKLSVLAAVGALAGASLLSSCSSADDTVAQDPGSSATSAPVEATETAGTTETASPTEAATQQQAPYASAAMEAVNHNLPAMVPSVLPAGWTSGAGNFQAEPAQWTLDLTAPSGPVTLHQTAGSVEEVMAPFVAGAKRRSDVDLGKWGTGTWQHYSTQSGDVLAFGLKDSAVVITAPDLQTAKTLAKSLLPAEDAVPSGDE